MALVEVVFEVPAAQVEKTIFHLVEYAPQGFRADTDREERGEFGVWTEATESQALLVFLARVGIEVLDSHVDIVSGDWAERWKEFHQPVTVGSLWVGPPWQVEHAPTGVRRVVVEPGQGFGTGAHPTTRLVLSLLQEQAPASVLDIGCGSGVLAIAAAVLGFAPVEAVDNDEAAVVSTRENLERNGVQNQVSVRRLDVLQEPVPRADIVLANLTLEPLVRLAPLLHAPRVIASGLLRSQADTAVAAFEAAGYAMRERRDRDGWVALVLDNAREGEQTMYHRPIA